VVQKSADYGQNWRFLRVVVQIFADHHHCQGTRGCSPARGQSARETHAPGHITLWLLRPCAPKAVISNFESPVYWTFWVIDFMSKVKVGHLG